MPLQSYPALRPGQYEATTWRHADHAGTMDLVRWDERSALRSPDRCTMQARVAGKAQLGALISGMERRMGRAPDRSGAVPRGGDFLTPRSDAAQTGHYWAMARSDVYLQTAPDGFASIDVVAMPDRASLDRYSPDRPENRIVILPEESQR